MVGKFLAKVKSTLPKSPPFKVKDISALVVFLLPSSKTMYLRVQKEALEVGNL